MTNARTPQERPEDQDQARGHGRKLRPGETLPAATGDCFEAAAKYLLDHHGEEDVVLVHAVCLIGVGEHEGLPFGHAWCEVTPQVEAIPEELRIFGAALRDSLVVCRDVSNGRDISMPRPPYYMGGRPDQIHRYTFDEALKLLLEHGHWGPWELECDR